MTWERARIRFVRSAGIAVVACATALGSAPAAQSTARGPRRSDLLVKFKPGTTNGQRQAALVRAGAKLRKRFARTGIEHLELAADAPSTALETLQADPSVLYAQPNYIRQAVAGAPNDPAWTNHTLWGLTRISAPSAWAAFPPAARDVVVAVIDTGINYRHADLAASVWRNRGEVAGNGMDDDGNGYVDDVYGIDTLNQDSDPFDDNGHGTHTAGTIGAQGDNGIGALGVAWSPQVLSCKFLDSGGSGTDAAAIACFEYLIDLKVNRGVNIRVANNSWGSLRNPNAPFPYALRDTIDSAGQAGIISVFAAGNDGVNDDATPFDPASFSSPSIVSVAASDENDARAAFSNFGATAVDLAAPGTNIYSTYGDGYAYSSGTSMAAPHVSGALALMVSHNPALTVPALKSVLLASADRLPQWTGVTVTGARLNVFAALVAATETGIPAGTLADGWNHADVGATGAVGHAALANGTFEIGGAGADVWGTADAFHYAYRTLDGDGTIVARVAGIQLVNNWTKAGVMIRNSLSPSAAQAFMLVAASAVKGAPFQRRTGDGAASASTQGSQSTAPRWVKLVRSGTTITGYESADGSAWTLVGRDTFVMGRAVLVGLAVSSHVTGVNATAVFDSVTVTAAASVPAPAAVWAHRDVGVTGLTGNATGADSSYSVTGSGADVWGTADAFHYVYSTLSGNGTIVARVTAVQSDVNAWVKAGVMIRESLTADSPHGFMLMSAAKGAAFQRRRARADTSVGTAGTLSGAPRWVKLQRSGDQFTAFESTDGVAWTLVGTDTIPMAANVYVGVAVSSHVAGTPATCAFDNIRIQ